MPQLIIPNEAGGLQNVGGINSSPDTSTTAETGAALSNTGNSISVSLSGQGRAMGQATAQFGQEIGQTSAQLGANLQRLGQQYFDKAQGAIEDSIYNDRYSKMITEYNTRVQDRLSRPYDANGNPTFGSLQNDINIIGEDMKNKYGNVSSPRVRARLQQAITELNTSKQIAALGEARKQQIDYAQGALSSAIISNTNNALAGSPEDLDKYYAEGTKQIDNAVRNGYMDASASVKVKEKLRHDIYHGYLSIMIANNPKQAAELLNSNTNLGITPEEKSDLLVKTNKALEDVAVEQQKQEREKQAILTQQQLINKEKLETDLQRGIANEATINELGDRGGPTGISEIQRQQVLQKYYAARGESLEKAAKRSAILQDIQDGRPLAQYSNSEINDSYQASLKTISGPDKKPVSLYDKAKTASLYQHPVTDFQNEISANMVSGTPEQAIQAAQAYAFVHSKQPLAVDGMEAKSQAMAVSINNAMQYSNQKPAEVIDSVRKRILEADDSIQGQREKEFTIIPEFRGLDAKGNNNLNATISKIYGAELDTWGPINNSLSPDVVPAINRLLQQAYVETGNVKDAMRLVHDRTAGVIGLSKVNATTSFGATKDQLMAFPPEFLFNNKYTSSEYRRSVEADVVGKLPAGIDASRVFIKSDSVTAQKVQRNEMPSYEVYYMDSNNVPHPVLDEKGLPQRWQPGPAQMDQWRSERTKEKQMEFNSRQKSQAPGNAFVPGYIKNTMDKLKQAVGKNKSSGNYKAVGPLVKGGAHAGQRAYGKYQIMEGNIGPWSKEAIGRKVSVQEFLNNPEIQDKIFEYKMSQYLKNGSLEDALSRWHSGKSHTNAIKTGVRDLGTGLRTVDYVRKIKKDFNGDEV